MAEPQVSIGKGRTQIVLRGEKAIEAVGWTVRLLIIARAIVLVLAPLVTLLGIARWAGLF